jgi:hypothetical protein
MNDTNEMLAANGVNEASTTHEGQSRFLILGGVLWVLLIGMGFMILAREEFTPAVGVASTGGFPAHSSIALDRLKPTLLLFAHPQCPCTRATFSELDRLLLDTHQAFDVVIVFTIPKGAPTGWEQGDLWSYAARMPGVIVFRDDGGTETERFHAHGSGQVLVYLPSGDLLFAGGITSARGHEGDNSGLSALVNFARTGAMPVNHTPVFGCSLL